MKNLLLFLLLYSFSICTNAQKIRFTDSTNAWHVAQSAWPYITTYYFGQSVTINGQFYRPLINARIVGGDTTLLSNQFLVREDTTLSRVYFIDTGSPDTSEQLLYRYDLSLGDTVQFKYYTDSVVAIDSQLIDGYYYKVYTMRDTGSSTTLMHAYTYVEGIGAIRGPLYPIVPICFFEYSVALCCFQNKGNYPEIYLEYQNCEYNWVFNNDSCNCELPPYSGINEIKKNVLHVEILPNPLQPSSIIKWKEQMEQGKLSVTDAVGRSVVTKEIRNANSIPIGQLIKETGIFFYEITDIKNKRSARGKLVVF